MNKDASSLYALWNVLENFPLESGLNSSESEEASRKRGLGMEFYLSTIPCDKPAPILWSPFSCAREARAAEGEKGTITWAQTRPMKLCKKVPESRQRSYPFMLCHKNSILLYLMEGHIYINTVKPQLTLCWGTCHPQAALRLTGSDYIVCNTKHLYYKNIKYKTVYTTISD